LKLLLFCAVSLLFVGCKSVLVRDVLAECKDPKFARTVEAGNHRIELRYLPRALRLLNKPGINDSSRFTRDFWDSVKQADPKPGTIFLLTLSPKDTSKHGDFSNDIVYGPSGGFRDYREALNAYQFGLSDKIWVEAGGRKIPLAGYQMENTFGMTQSRTFVLAFPELARENRSSVKVVLDDIIPGLSRRKLEWDLTMRKYD
jgi:hypothetical protein